MRDATSNLFFLLFGFCYFNPRVPCGTRPNGIAPTMPFAKFQSTRPMRDATILSTLVGSVSYIFQSTRPMRDATSSSLIFFANLVISIHASHAGRDSKVLFLLSIKDISIHASHAGRDN